MITPNHLVLTFAALALLGGCAGGAPVGLEEGSDPRGARHLLAETAAAGPVLVTWRGEPPLAESQLLRAVEQGVRGLRISTTSEGTAARRFAFDFSGSGETLCGDSAEAVTPAAFTVRAAFCDDDRAIALATAEPGGDPARLVWRLTGRLVPDDYPETYGFHLFGNRIGFRGDFGY